jgi:hypothetical protein
MAVRIVTLLLTLALGACSVSGLWPDWQSEDMAGPEPDYRLIVTNGLNGIVGSPNIDGTVQISGVRRVSSLKGAAWVVCLRTQQLPLPPRHYAVFIQRNQIVSSRLSVVIDQCELQTYTPFGGAFGAPGLPR